MNPFDQPPTAPPVSLDPPSASGHGGHDGPRRGRMALAALAAAGLVGGGLVVVGQFASADRPTLGTAATVDEPVATTVPDASVDDGTPDDTGNDTDGETDDGVSIDGEIVIDDGDGEPTVIDLGDLEGRVEQLAECLGGPILQGTPMFDLFEDGPTGPRGPVFDEDFHQRMEQYMEEFLGELDLGELDLGDDGVRIFGSGGSTVTVVGPDGVEVIDLGDGDATVTIEQRDGEVTVETDGTATVSELPQLPSLGDLELGELGELDLGELGRQFDLDQMPWGDGELGDLLPLDELESCLDELNLDDPSGD